MFPFFPVDGDSAYLSDADGESKSRFVVDCDCGDSVRDGGGVCGGC